MLNKNAAYQRQAEFFPEFISVMDLEDLNSVAQATKKPFPNLLVYSNVNISLFQCQNIIAFSRIIMQLI